MIFFIRPTILLSVLFLSVLLNQSCSTKKQKKVLADFSIISLREYNSNDTSYTILNYSYTFRNDTIYYHELKNNVETWQFTLLAHVDFVKYRSYLNEPNNYHLLRDKNSAQDQSMINYCFIPVVNYIRLNGQTYYQKTPLKRLHILVKILAENKFIQTEKSEISSRMVSWEKDNIRKTINYFNLCDGDYLPQEEVNFLEPTSN